MAPSRRKGASKAAAAAAARRQWKVGDLVLAKVKGFPAWPATVSEPEKWGYSSDWKKVLVYFFGTQQIAFCNPADVEAFTEEKKQSLLMKRQGKGADFVRAVQEIIDSYEKLKKQDQVDDSNSGVVSLANGGNSVDSPESKDLTETSEAMLDLRFKTSNSTTARNDSGLLTDDTTGGTEVGALHDKESVLEQHADNDLVKEKPLLTTYSSRRRSGSLRSQKSVVQQNAQLGRRARSSSRVESTKLQSLMMPCNDGGKSAVNLSTNVINDGSLRRNKKVRKSPDASESDDVNSSAFIENGSVDDNDSEIATVDSDTVSLNEGSTIDSGSKPEQDTVVQCLEGAGELSKGLDFQIKAVVIKKKRKPNRKRTTNDSAEPPSKMEVDADLDLEAHNVRQNSQNTGENLSVGHSKEDGDEHLPLVKRARVRMGKISSVEEFGCFSKIEERTCNDAAVSASLSSCHEDRPADRDSLEVKGTSVNVSPLNGGPQVSGSRPQPWRVTRNQFSSSADGEAALPPSKRLHRALEAMSANAAEEGEMCAKTSPTMKSLVNGCCGSPMTIRSQLIEGKEANSLELHGVDSLGNVDSGSLSRSNPIILDKSAKYSMDADTCNQLVKNPGYRKIEFTKDMSMEPMDHFDGENSSGSSIDADHVKPMVENQSVEQLSPNFDKNHASFRSNSGSSDQQLPSKNDVDAEQHDSSGHTESPVRVSGADITVKGSPQDCLNLIKYAAEHMHCNKADSLKSQMDDCSLVNSMCEAVEEVQHKESQKNMSSDLLSDEHMAEKDVRLSSPSIDGVDSPARVSPTNTSVCHMSTSESANIIQSNGCCSPNVHSHNDRTLSVASAEDEGKTDSVASERPRSVSKSSNSAEAHATLSSFENMLGTLTRTKESIGRATHMAIDCAKFGASAKVVEIVARKLERESSLHRRIDLFFLVDSITQCSRGLKGHVGSMYPSAIQAALPRLLSAAAPPGSGALENRRQCLKVLRLWLERRILPESVIRHHIRELDSLNTSSSGAFSRRSARTERAFDDPVREMEGMLVDEYGSNSSFQLPGFCMPCMLKDEDEGSDSDGESFEAVTPEHQSGSPEDQEANLAIEKRRHILEDVDGELEMEDVAPSEAELTSASNVAGVNIAQTSQDRSEQHYPLPFAPPLPQDVPPSSPPLPSSPPPPPPPPPCTMAVPPPCPMSGSYANGVDSKIYDRQDDLKQSVAPPSVGQRTNSALCTNAAPYQGHESRDHHASDCDSSFNRYSGRSVSGMHQTDGPVFHNKPYPPRPPFHAPSDQFSYVQSGQHMKSQREAPPPPYSHRFHYEPNNDRGHFYNSHHERLKMNSYEFREGWRVPPAPSFSGPRYPDKAKASFGHGSYGHPPFEPTRLPNQQGWGYPPRGMHHRNSFSMRPPPEGPVPVGLRGPNFWRPR